MKKKTLFLKKYQYTHTLLGNIFRFCLLFIKSRENLTFVNNKRYLFYNKLKQFTLPSRCTVNIFFMNPGK